MGTVLVPAKAHSRSKTIIANVLVIVAGLLEVLVNSGDLIGPTAAYTGIALALVNIILRKFTVQPVSTVPGEMVPVEVPKP